ncbi:polyprenyl diphosphate synthase [Pseudostreptobacillus hongkongensis]|uniref:polyprenyl diphosphate synthase n=1 Tax=Pseudostreptobacillus hongkongensis TaxID=1162717 RepID=UPI00082D13FB|nr:polyprenyl diphosphate synthase [Pseudostreptobacillus hongkongensis]
MSILKNYTKDKFPKHIAIIMDGNGRWAKNKSMIRTRGHEKGAETLENILKKARSLGIEYLSVYAFSTENWKRPKLEVDAIMKLFSKYLEKKKEEFKNNDIRLVISGNRENLSKSLLKQINEIEDYLKDCKKIVLNICFNYGARTEIVDGIKKLIEDKIEINEENISKYLYNSFIPEPDLLIRTGGEFRLSNFLLWQIAYSEIYVTDILWPDFNEDDFEKAILSYINRDRRFGNVK